ncbi:thiol-disulfide oxidoreductase DCC family protein [Micromonospora sp. ATA51]|uniref:thiol-disulfide oxidoreductase DCC family protein n=1 Tax=Micromonospora sp. ATA51 TaxID=2806098 RepID=UPI001EE45CE9|nr:DCC1-like thiol-disulfide oxidoreductase family protein [Micromonospora sp. ATA51]
METSTFVYDGDCAFCSRCAEFIERRIPTGARVLPWQFADLAALGLTEAECEEAVQWIGADGSRASGPDAIAKLLGDSGPLWRFAGTACASRRCGRRVAGVPLGGPQPAPAAGGTAACSLPQEARERLYGPSGRPTAGS